MNIEIGPGIIYMSGKAKDFKIAEQSAQELIDECEVKE